MYANMVDQQHAICGETSMRCASLITRKLIASFFLVKGILVTYCYL